MISAAHPLAAQAGLDILRKGGNAFDSAVAVAAALNVVEPMMSGIGGYGTIVIHDAKTNLARFLDSSGRIPKGVDSDAFRAPTRNYMENRRGPKAISTPGNVNAWRAMSNEYGTLPWNELFEPAAALAEQGFVLDERTASMIRSAFGSFSECTRSFYGKDGRPLASGDRLVQKDLSRSLRTIADEGAGAVYGSELGVAIDKGMREAGSFLRLADLVDAKAEWWHPISIKYRGYEIVTASPPANSFPFPMRIWGS